MIKNAYNLKKLCSKLQHRFGENDDLVLQLKRELEAHEVIESQQGKFLLSYADFIKTWHTLSVVEISHRGMLYR